MRCINNTTSSAVLLTSLTIIFAANAAPVRPNMHTNMAFISPPSSSSLSSSSSSFAGKKSTKTTKSGEKCVLCSTCSCTRPKGSDVLKSFEETALYEEKNPLSRQAKSNAEIERALINRLGRLEKSASYFDHLCIKVSKELKKHRKKIIKEREEKSKRAKIADDSGENGKEHGFLDDMGDALFHDKSLFSCTKFPSNMVQKARSKIHTYAFRRKCQPTLTQMLGDDDDSNDEVAIDCVKNTSDDFIDLNNESSELDYNKSTERHAIAGEVTMLKERPSSLLTFVNEKDKLPFDTFVDYEVASSRGKVRGLWGLSSITEKEMKETKQPDFEECISFVEEDYTMQSTNSLCERLLSVEENDGLEILVDLFGDINDNEKDVEEYTSKSSNTESEQTDILPLSPRGRELCSSIKSNIVKDAGKMEIIAKGCPSWEENITFAFHQGSDELQEALCNVREKRSRIKKARELLEIMQRKDVVLDLFESVITKSLARHSPLDCFRDN
mmetsp:Transcript_10385/g.15634  ORF Transcript_10385/g.15634 Transcript_10385/m.15634 type:complete len:499 (-) Transcript_10385:809-2305(-)